MLDTISGMLKSSQLPKVTGLSSEMSSRRPLKKMLTPEPVRVAVPPLLAEYAMDRNIMILARLGLFFRPASESLFLGDST